MARLHSVAWITVLLMVHASQELPSEINIGAVFKNEQLQEEFKNYTEEINGEPGALPHGVRLNAFTMLSQENPIRTALDVCEVLMSRNVSVVIVGNTPNTPLCPVAISYTCGVYKIPVIGLAARDSAFSDKNVHSSFLRVVPAYSHQVVAWIKIIQDNNWKSVIVLHSSDQEGRFMLSRLQSLADHNHIKIERTIYFFPKHKNYTEVLLQIPSLRSRIILLYADQEDARIIFKQATQLNLTSEGFAWIVTQQALSILPREIPVGVIGLRLKQGLDESLHMKEAVRVIASAVKSLQLSNAKGEEVIQWTSPPQCVEKIKPWNFGHNTLISLLRNVHLDDGTGEVRFDSFGDRVTPTYSILNKQSAGLVEVGLYKNNSREVDQVVWTPDEKVVWPGNTTKVPKGIKISTHLRIVTHEEVPFVITEPAVKGRECAEAQKLVPCSHYNSSTGTLTEFCCKGYCIDMLLELKVELNITYALYIVPDGKFGDYQLVNKTGEKQWNGMVGELVHNKADMIVAPLTIGPERAEHIDFSKPFKYQGLTVLVKKQTKDSGLTSFLQPFQDSLWILVAVSVHVVALVLYLLDRFSPFGRFKLAKSDDTEEDALNLPSAMWFAWGVILNSGIGEGTPRSFSARVLGMVWAGFAMIIVASYTANLAAFLVLDRPDAQITGIDDARLRNPTPDFEFATVKNSNAMMYFKRQVELSTMYRFMEKQNYYSPDQAIAAVKNSKLEAFIWDSSRLEYEASKDCDLITAGEMFGRSGFGIGLQKDSPWTHHVSLAVLKLHERGDMEKLDNKWILVKGAECPQRDQSPATLGLTNMAGVFMLVAGGIVSGVVLIFIEMAYKRHRAMRQRELHLARRAVQKWRATIERRQAVRETVRHQQENNGIIDSCSTPSLATGSRLRQRNKPDDVITTNADVIVTQPEGSSSSSRDVEAGTSSARQLPPSYSTLVGGTQHNRMLY